MPGEDLAAQGDSPGGQPQDGSTAALGRAVGRDDDTVDAAEEKRQPNDGRGNHGENGRADDQELRPLIDKSGQGGPAPPHAQDATEEIHRHTGQPHLTEGKPAIGLGQRHDQKDEAKRIEGRMLAIGQEGRPGEQIGVPQREITLAEAGEDEILPGEVLDDQVADEGVMGRNNAGR